MIKQAFTTSRSLHRNNRITSTVAALALPVVIVSAALLGPVAAANHDEAAPDHHALGLGDDLPRTIDLSELETRSLEHFARLDSNSDGLIDAAEYAAGTIAHPRKRRLQKGPMARQHAPTHHNLEEDGHIDREAMAAHLFERLDTDQNGELSREEFAVQHEIRQKLHKERHQQRRFDRLDADDDSQITLDEFQQRLEKMRALDSDANGFVSRAELRRGMNERRSSLRRLDKRTDS